jgi:hypothetical protein
MKKSLFVLIFMLFSIYSHSAEKREDVYLKQVDYRHRTNFSFSIPGSVRLRVRPSYEYRFRFKDKIQYKESEQLSQREQL